MFLYRRLIVRFTLLAVVFALLAPALVHGVRIWQGAQLLDLCSARGAHQMLQFADGHVAVSYTHLTLPTICSV